MIEKIKTELMHLDEDIRYMEDADTAWFPEYAMLCKKRKILKATLRKLERLEAKAKW